MAIITVDNGIELWKPLCRLHSSTLLETVNVLPKEEPCNDIRYMMVVVMKSNNSMLLAVDDVYGLIYTIILFNIKNTKNTGYYYYEKIGS